MSALHDAARCNEALELTGHGINVLLYMMQPRCNQALELAGHGINVLLCMMQPDAKRPWN